MEDKVKLYKEERSDLYQFVKKQKKAYYLLK